MGTVTDVDKIGVEWCNMFYKVPLGVAMTDTPAVATAEPVLSGFRVAPNSVAVVFCGGTGRCGTNVLKRVFARHPEVYTLPFEIRFLLDPGGIIDFYTSYSTSWSPFLADDRIRRLRALLADVGREQVVYHLPDWLALHCGWGRWVAPRRYAGWELARHLPRFRAHNHRLLRALVEFSYDGVWPGTASYTVAPEVAFAPPQGPDQLRALLGGYLATLFAELLRSTRRRVLFLDETWALLFMRELHELLPRARFIHMLRDPRDVIASFSQQRWCPRDRVAAARFYLELMDRILAHRQELGTRYYEVRLEALVAEPRLTLTNLCEFLGLAFTEELLEVDLSRPHSDRWRSEFNAHERQAINALVSEKLMQLGYPPEHESVEN